MTTKHATKPAAPKPEAGATIKLNTKPADKTQGKPEAEKKDVLGSKEAAAKLHIEPRYLRVVLRASGKGSDGERYEFTDHDLPKLKQMVEAYEAKKAAAAKEASKKE